MKRREGARARRKSVLVNDAVIVKIVTTIKEAMKSIQVVAAYQAAHPRYLSIPDATTRNEFLEKAKQVYREAHIPVLKRGPRPKESFAIDQLGYFSQELGRQPTNSEMTKLLTNRELLGQNKLSKNTAGKYAKLYHLSKQDPARFSQADQQWLCKEFGSESLSPAWWDERFWQWFAERVRSSGVGEEIRKILEEYTPTELQQERDKMEMLRLQRHERYANQRQQAGFTNAKDGLTKKLRPRPKMSRGTSG